MAVAAATVALAASAAAEPRGDAPAWPGALPPPSAEAWARAVEPSAAACPTGLPEAALSLADVIARALCHDPHTRQTWARARAEAANVDQARAAYRPSVSAGAEVGIGQVRLREADSDEPSRGSRSAWAAGVELSWLLFDFGVRDAETEAARLTLRAATASYDARMQATVLDAVEAYYAVANARSIVTLESEVEEFARRILEDATSRSSQRRVGPVDELQARAALAQAMLDKSVAESELRFTQGRLAALLGLRPDATVRIDADDGAGPESGAGRAIADLLQQALDGHPLIQASDAQRRAAQAGVDAARRALRPRVDLAAGTLRGADRFGGRLRERRLALQLSIPLYDGRVADARRRAAQAELRGAEAESEIVRREVALDVWDAFQSLQAEATTLEHAGRVLEIARELLRVEIARYRGERYSATPSAALSTGAAAASTGTRTLAGTESSVSSSAPALAGGAPAATGRGPGASGRGSTATFGTTVASSGGSAAPARAVAAPASAPARGRGADDGDGAADEPDSTDVNSRDEDDEYDDEGDMLELLYAHRTVADSALQRQQALVNWRAARWRLAASLGQLGVWSTPQLKTPSAAPSRAPGR